MKTFGKRYAKFLVAAAVAAGSAAVPLLGDGHLDAQDWSRVGVASLAAVLVLLVPNKPKPPEA